MNARKSEILQATAPTS